MAIRIQRTREEIIKLVDILRFYYKINLEVSNSCIIIVAPYSKRWKIIIMIGGRFT